MTKRKITTIDRLPRAKVIEPDCPLCAAGNKPVLTVNPTAFDRFGSACDTLQVLAQAMREMGGAASEATMHTDRFKELAAYLNELLPFPERDPPPKPACIYGMPIKTNQFMPDNVIGIGAAPNMRFFKIEYKGKHK